MTESGIPDPSAQAAQLQDAAGQLVQAQQTGQFSEGAKEMIADFGQELIENMMARFDLNNMAREALGSDSRCYAWCRNERRCWNFGPE